MSEDLFGKEFEVGQAVVWVYNFPVTGGSKPYLAFGTINRLTDRMIFAKVFRCPKYPEAEGTEIRALQSGVTILDSEILTRLFPYVISA